MLSVYETLLNNINIKLLKSNRTNAELSDKLHKVFEDNKAEFENVARMYDGNRQKIHERMDYELQQIENLRKRRYGDNYTKTNG